MLKQKQNVIIIYLLCTIFYAVRWYLIRSLVFLHKKQFRSFEADFHLSEKTINYQRLFMKKLSVWIHCWNKYLKILIITSMFRGFLFVILIRWSLYFECSVVFVVRLMKFGKFDLFQFSFLENISSKTILKMIYTDKWFQKLSWKSNEKFVTICFQVWKRPNCKFSGFFVFICTNRWQTRNRAKCSFQVAIKSA